ncbi:hypothetical protein NGA35_17635 [Pseudomonas stutzeri]|nr:hypothetical protein [Stutzerimonas stutzeri]
MLELNGTSSLTVTASFWATGASFTGATLTVTVAVLDVAVDVAVVGQQADAGAERHVLADGDRIVLGHWRVVHRSHVDRDGGGVGCRRGPAGRRSPA